MRTQPTLASMAVTAGLLLAAGPATATPAPDPAKDCKKGYVLTGAAAQPASDYDTDGNGFVCFDPATGSYRDDKGQFAPAQGGGSGIDQNMDNLVCYNPEQGAIIDNDQSLAGETEPVFCPEGDWILMPAVLFP